MKSPLLASLLLVHFYLDATDKQQKMVPKKQRTASGSVPFMTEATIKPLLASDLSFLMIGADWCSHCKKMQPLFYESYQKEKGKIAHGFLPLGNSFPEATQIIRALEKRYNLQIDAIPVLLVFKKNKLVEYIPGALTKEQLSALARKHTTSVAATPEKSNLTQTNKKLSIPKS